MNVTAPATEDAKKWSGWGTALKPAWEPVIVARRPLIGTVAANVLKHGTGAINIDACRVEYLSEDDKASATPQGAVTSRKAAGDGGLGAGYRETPRGEFERPEQKGRWPANFVHDGSEEVVGLFPTTTSGKPVGKRAGTSGESGIYGSDSCRDGSDLTGYGDTGSAARFFYCAKASKSERDKGCQGLEVRNNMRVNAPRTNEEAKYATKLGNNHPTVKPTDHMRYLCRLVTPPGGIVLDPFMGSGSTGVAAGEEGFAFIGIEREAEYMAIAEQRIYNFPEWLK